jgi:hypothetical protein
VFNLFLAFGPTGLLVASLVFTCLAKGKWKKLKLAVNLIGFLFVLLMFIFAFLIRRAILVNTEPFSTDFCRELRGRSVRVGLCQAALSGYVASLAFGLLNFVAIARETKYNMKAFSEGLL